MPKLDRYLLSEFAQSTFAALVVLLVVSLGGVFTDVLADITRGRVPAGMMFSQLGLVLLNWLPIILPLALMIGLMLAVGRLYRDSEMPVIASIGAGPARLLRPLLWVVVPVIALVAASSLWLGPWAEAVSKRMISEANRNMLASGLEPGRFTSLSNGGVAFVGGMSADGSRFDRVFIYRQRGDRIDVVTSNEGELQVDDSGRRYLQLINGFEVEGPVDGGLDFRLMRYRRNEVQLPAGESRFDPTDPELMTTPALLDDPRPEAQAQLHRRIAPPLLALAFALMAVPLARSTPRQARYGRVLMGFLAYLVATNLMLMGTRWIEDGKTPSALGLWWLVVPLLAFALWLYFGDGRLRRSRAPKVARA
ncbi:LPS export ABC transporter permease LptF [Lysobacter korlensis]|uniref:Lipopolysaccharide export system permease protein LptF n=1 Tax=Lysobacter korlensis TaxID=553636 RepID=A0ABV6RIT6_9GAMM